MKQNPRRVLKLTVLLALFTALCACSHSSSDSPPKDPKVLAAEDVAKLGGIGESGFKKTDQVTNGLITQIFGGTSSQYISGYFNERIKLMVSEDELKNGTISSEKSSYHWSNHKDAEMEAREKALHIKTAAANASLNIWLKGLTDHVVFTFSIGSRSLEITSPHAGIMLIGPGYQEKSDDGRVVLPAEYRMGILIHEARHSDCTGGLDQSDLDFMNKTANQKEFVKGTKAIACGHWHAFCPEGHKFAGVDACDDHPWGSYAIEAIFARAAAENLSGTDREIVRAQALDSASRVLFSFDDLLSGKFGSPDMVSTGLRKN